MTSTASFTIVRHGQTGHNRVRRIQGQFNSQLDDDGWAQAAAVARRLQTCHFDAVYASDLDRTVDTVRAIVGDRPVTLLPALREWHLGDWQNQLIDDLKQLYPEEYAIYSSGSPDFVAPGGESHDQLSARVVACFNELANRHLGQSILVVTHGGALRALIYHVFGVRRLPCGPLSHNTSVNRFLYHQDRGWQLELWNDTSHLETNASQP